MSPPPVAAVEPDPTTLPRFWEACERVTPAPAVTVGKRPERAARTAARAPRNCASAWASVWFETSICSSSAESCGSPKASHHAPRSASSCGRAGRKAPASAGAPGGSSLNSGDTGAEGRW